jgi:hypothetical protein
MILRSLRRLKVTLASCGEERVFLWYCGEEG